MELNKIINDKEEITIYDFEVNKKYFDNKRNVLELATLIEANLFFKPIKIDGWNYELVEVIGGSEKDGILMKRATGIPMREDINFDIDNYYHAGVWLGYFHSLSIDGSYVKSFSDFGIPNILVDYKNKKITCIDLGEGALKVRDYYYDLLYFLFGTITSHLKRKTVFNKDCIVKFIEGYSKYSVFKYEKNLFDKNIVKIIGKWNNSSRRKRTGIIKFYLGYLVLWYYLNFTLKNTLKHLYIEIE